MEVERIKNCRGPGKRHPVVVATGLSNSIVQFRLIPPLAELILYVSQCMYFIRRSPTRQSQNTTVCRHPYLRKNKVKNYHFTRQSAKTFNGLAVFLEDVIAYAGASGSSI